MAPDTSARTSQGERSYLVPVVGLGRTPTSTRAPEAGVTPTLFRGHTDLNFCGVPYTMILSCRWGLYYVGFCSHGTTRQTSYRNQTHITVTKRRRRPSTEQGTMGRSLHRAGFDPHLLRLRHRPSLPHPSPNPLSVSSSSQFLFPRSDTWSPQDPTTPMSWFNPVGSDRRRLTTYPDPTVPTYLFDRG